MNEDQIEDLEGPDLPQLVERVGSSLEEKQQDLPKTGLKRKVKPAFLQTMDDETLLKNPVHAESQWSGTPEMPDGFEWSAICEMPVAFGDPSQTELPGIPRKLDHVEVPAHGILKKHVVSETPGLQDGVMTGTMTPNKPLTEDLFVFPCRHQLGAQDIRRFVEAFTLTVAFAHSSLMAGRHPPSQLASCLPLSALRNTRPRPLHPPNVSLITPSFRSAPRPPALSASLRLDGSQAKSPSKPRSCKEPPGDAEPPGTHDTL